MVGNKIFKFFRICKYWQNRNFIITIFILKLIKEGRDQQHTHTPFPPPSFCKCIEPQGLITVDDLFLLPFYILPQDGTKVLLFLFQKFLAVLAKDQAKDIKMYLIWLSGWGTGGNMRRPAPLERAWRLHALSPYGALCMPSVWLFLSSVIQPGLSTPLAEVFCLQTTPMFFLVTLCVVR